MSSHPPPPPPPPPPVPGYYPPYPAYPQPYYYQPAPHYPPQPHCPPPQPFINVIQKVHGSPGKRRTPTARNRCTKGHGTGRSRRTAPDYKPKPSSHKTGGRPSTNKKPSSNAHLRRAEAHNRARDEGRDPPSPCRRCGGQHWTDRCPRGPASLGSPSPRSPLPRTPRSTRRPDLSPSPSQRSRFPPPRSGSASNGELAAILEGFRGFCCRVGPPTLADLHAVHVKLMAQLLTIGDDGQPIIDEGLRREWNDMVRAAAQQRFNAPDGELWVRLEV